MAISTFETLPSNQTVTQKAMKRQGSRAVPGSMFYENLV